MQQLLFNNARNARAAHVHGLASRVLAETDGRKSLAMIQAAAADAGAGCSLLLVQHAAGECELVTPLYSAAGGEVLEAFEAGIGDIPSVQQACASGQPLVLRHYGAGGPGEQRYADLDGFHEQVGAGPLLYCALTAVFRVCSRWHCGSVRAAVNGPGRV